MNVILRLDSLNTLGGVRDSLCFQAELEAIVARLLVPASRQKSTRIFLMNYARSRLFGVLLLNVQSWIDPLIPYTSWRAELQSFYWVVETASLPSIVKMNKQTVRIEIVLRRHQHRIWYQSWDPWIRRLLLIQVDKQEGKWGNFLDVEARKGKIWDTPESLQTETGSHYISDRKRRKNTKLSRNLVQETRIQLQITHVWRRNR